MRRFATSRPRLAALLQCGALVLAVLAAGCDLGAGETEAPSAQPQSTVSTTTQPVLTPTPDPPAPAAEPVEPEPTPAVIEESRYLVSAVTVEIEPKAGWFYEATIRAVILNPGGAADSYPIPVEMKVDDLDPVVVHEIDRPGPVPLITTMIRLDAGSHNVEVAVAGSHRSAQVDIPFGDLAIELRPYTVLAPGSVEIPIAISNVGQTLARDVWLSGVWKVFPYNYRDAARMDAVVDRIEPGATEIVKFRVKVRPGPISLYLHASSTVVEARVENNVIETSPSAPIQIEYPQLALSLGEPAVTSYDASGRAIVQVEAVVENSSLSPASKLGIWILDRAISESGDQLPGAIARLEQCREPLAVNCWRLLGRSLGRGGRALTSLRIAVPPGKYELDLVATGANAQHQLSEEQIALLVFDAPAQSGASIAAEFQSSVAGYYSDDTADVELAGSLRSIGTDGAPVPDAVMLTCHAGDGQLSNCGGVVPVAGPAGAISTTLRVPMGRLISVEVRTESGQLLSTTTLEAPERILGVERSVWECYNDREIPPELLAANSSPETYVTPLSCGGWIGWIVQKWDPGRPVHIWSYWGSPEARTEALRAYAALDDLVDNEIVIVGSRAEANLVGYVGIDQSDVYTSTEIDISRLDCFGAGGCAEERRGAPGDVESGQFVCWSDFTNVYACVLHELAHIVGGNSHRDALDSRNGIHSRMDQAMLRLNGHRLLKPGMTMEEARSLIVLADELLNPPAVTNYEQLSSAAFALQRAGTAQFEVRGAGDHQSCPAPFGWAQYAFSGPANYPEHEQIRFTDAGAEFWIDERGLGTVIEDTWLKTSFEELRRETGWHPSFTNPVAVLKQILGYGNAEQLTRRVLPDGDVQFFIGSMDFWSYPYTYVLLNASITLSGTTGEIAAFEWVVDGATTGAYPCKYRVEGRNPVFGQPLSPPPAS